jgi:hypothetical protein
VKKRGRRTLLNAKLQKEICGYLSDCCTIRTACEATSISETSFFDWIRRGEAGERPFAQFAQAVTRARGRAKAMIVRSLLDEKDWRARLELLARVFPDEYGRRDPVPPPPPPPEPPPDLSRSVKIQVPDGFFEQMHDEKARMVTALMKLLPVGAGINPRTGVITLRDGTVISPDGSKPQPEQPQHTMDAPA